MNLRSLLLTALVLASGGVAAWWFWQPHATPTAPLAKAKAERRLLYYQSPMHPWITSPEPGNCTICGMKLVPVYEGEKTDRLTEAGLLRLPKETVEVIGVTTEQVKERELASSLRVSGIIDDDNSRHRLLTAWAEGRIEKLYVTSAGVDVVQGQPLATYSSRELVSAQQEFLQLVSGGDLTATALPSARERLSRLGLTAAQITALEQQRKLTWSIEITAPIGGTVVNKVAYEGMVVPAGGLLYEVADFDHMWFEFQVYERDLGRVRVGQQVTLTTRTHPGRSWSAPITFIDPNFDEKTRSTKARVVLDNPWVGEGASKRREFSHRIYAEGRVTLDPVSALSIPRSAVLDSGSGPKVFVQQAPGVFEGRTVKLGRQGDGYLEVLEGLDAGEQVVVSGALLIDSQARITAIHGGGGEAMPEDKK